MKETMKAQGNPRNLEYVIPQQLQPGAGVSAAFEAKPGRVEPIVFARPFGGGATRIRLKFPPNTPPGSYRGTVRIGDSTHTAVVEVGAAAHIRISPGKVELSGSPGQRQTFELSVVNNGNVAYDIRATHGVGLFAEGGFEDALGAAYRKSEHGGQERVTIFADKLAASHGGLARIQLESGASALAPDEVRTVRTTIRFPDDLKRGHVYTGVLRIQDAQCEIRVDVPDLTGGERE